MNLLCRWFGHKWKRDGWYGKIFPYVIWNESPEKLHKKYVCQRCQQTAIGIMVGGHEYDNPYIKVRIMEREIKVPTYEAQ